MIVFLMLVLMVVLALLAVYLVRRPNIWDSVLAANVATNLVSIIIVLYSIHTDSAMYMDVTIIFALMGFIGSLFTMRYIYRKGDLR